MKKYEKIVGDLTDRMVRKELKKGEKLPSVRELSKRYACNKDTVIKAFQKLLKQELIYAVPKSGHYVLADLSQQDDRMDFKSSLPDLAQFSFGDFSICLNQVLHSRDRYLFEKTPDVRGLSDLIDSIYHLLPAYSVHTKKEQVFVTTGAQQALYILSRMRFPAEKKMILVEQPGYERMNQLIKELNLPYLTIERSLNGLDTDRLEALFSGGDIKFFYTVSQLHYPLGVTYREEEKIKIVELARRYGVYIVEDDYMADFENDSSLPLHYYDIFERVIYIKSFSSVVFPSLRIAVTVMPSALTEEFLTHKKLMDYDTNFLIQKALSIYIDNGMFSKHRARLLELHAEKNAALRRVLSEKSLKNCSVYDTKALFVIKEGVAINRLKKSLFKKFKLDFLEDCYIDGCPYRYLKIDVRTMSLPDIGKNLGDLIDLLAPYID